MPRVRKTIRIGGKRVSQYFRTKEAAERWYRKVSDQKDAVKSGMDLPPEWVTVKEFGARFILARKKKVGIGTWLTDEARMAIYILPKFGHRYLHDIDSQEWENFLVEVTQVSRIDEEGKTHKPLSISTSNRIRALVSRMYNEAMRCKPPHVARNPITIVRAFDEKKRRIGKIKENFFTDPDHMRAYLEACAVEEPGYLIYHCIGFNTGLRDSEKVALQWGDYEEPLKVLRVRRHYLSSVYKIEEGTKTFEPGEDYAVGVNDALASILSWWKQRSKYTKGTDWICSRANGKHFHVWHLRKAHARILKRAGLPEISPHGIRHSFSTHYLAKGGRLEDLKELLGHKSITTTEIYTHVLSHTLSEKANKLQVGADVLSRFCHQNEIVKEENKEGFE